MGDVELNIRFVGDDVQVQFPDEDVTISLAVTEVGSSLFRLENVPFMVEGAQFGDVVEGEWLSPGVLRVLRVAEHSQWRCHDFVLGKGVFESERVQGVLAQVDELGGYWENVFGGMLFICLPPGTEFDPTPRITG